jgi:PAS domain S-box-containing protein
MSVSWITVIFSMSAASCLTLGGVHLLRWLRGGGAWTSLLFSISAMAAAATAAFDLLMSRAQTPAQFGEILRWLHVPVWVMVVSLAWFLRFYLGTGRTWLLWLVCGSRTAALVLNFLFSPNLNFREITALRGLPFLGETISVPVGVTNPWTLVGQASLLLFVIYVVDTTLSAWRKGSRGRPLAMGGMLIVAMLVATAGSVLALWFHLPLPYLVGMVFLGLVAIMSYELSGDLLNAARLGRELRDSQERNRAMLAAIPDRMFLLSRDGVYLDYHVQNPKDLLVPPEQFMGRNMREVMPPPLAAKLSHAFDIVLRTGETQVFEYMLTLGGEDRFFEARIVRAGSDRLLGIGREITDRKRAEEGLRNMAAGVSAKIGATFFRSLAEHLSKVLQVEYAFVCETFDEGRHARTLAFYANGVEIGNIDYPMEGSPCEEVLKRGIAVFPQGLKASFPRDVQLQGMDVESYLGVCLNSPNGKPEGLIGVMSRQPLTNIENAKTILSIFAARASAELERKQAEDMLRLKEQDLKRSEERYREVVETQTELVCRHRADTTLTFVNEAYCKFFGLKREDLLGRKFLELATPAVQEKALRDIALLSEERKVITVEHEHVLPDGNMAWVHWSACAIVDADGTVAEFQAIGRDVTDRKRAEEATQNLMHASRLAAIGELTATIAHELNQPLGAVLANAESAALLLEQPVVPFGELREILTSITEQNLRAVETIQRIRALSRKRAMEIQPLDLNETVLDAMRLAQGDALRRRVQIHLNLSRPLPPLRGDPVHLQHVLLNLVLNSMDAMSDNAQSDRHVFVSTAYNGNGMVEVAVRDVGRGIPTPDLQRVFDSFFTTKRDGMGLGLSIARSIVQLHSGRIWAENNADGRGTTFHLAMPTNEYRALAFPARPVSHSLDPQLKS